MNSVERPLRRSAWLNPRPFVAIAGGVALAAVAGLVVAPNLLGSGPQAIDDPIVTRTPLAPIRTRRRFLRTSTGRQLNSRHPVHPVVSGSTQSIAL